MQRSELFGRIMSLIISHAGISSYIPIFGDLSENAMRWANDNPEKCDEIIDEAYRLIKQYKEGLK